MHTHTHTHTHAQQVFEAVGLSDEVVDRCFTGTTSRIQGADFGALYADIVKFHESAYPPTSSSESAFRFRL